MWEWLLPVLAVGGIFWRFVFLDNRVRSRLELWQSTAAACGLRVVETSQLIGARPGGWTWELQKGLLKVRLDEFLMTSTRVVVAVPGPPGFSEVRIRREQHRLLGAREIEIGDEIFDSTFFIEGPRRLVFVLLDGETRRLLIRVNSESRLKISGGKLRAEMPDYQVPILLPLLLDIAQRLTQPVDAARQLARNANLDPVEGVRLLNLLFLIRELPGEPETVEALRNACSDPSPEIRLRAARELGSKARDVLMELAESQPEDAVTAQAVSVLGRELPFDRASAILDQALRRRRLQTAGACLAALGKSGDAEAVDVLARVLAREQGELADAAALALGRTGSPAAEAPLIRALRRERAESRAAAAKALGRIGSAAAVPPLKEAAERFSHDPELRRAARQAIAEIQSRLPGASPGQLSLATDPAGQLSLRSPEEERG